MTNQSLPWSVDVVVVGAGIIGASIAHHLALRGVSAAVLEQAPGPAAGATRHSGGMVRAYDPNEVISDLARASLAMYRDAARWASGTSPLRAVGAVTIADAADETRLRRAARRINEGQGTAAEVVVDRDEVMGVTLGGGIALVEGDAGWVPPPEVTDDLLQQAVQRGASVYYGVPVRELKSQGGRPVVITSAGNLNAGVVVLAQGPWAARPLPGLVPRERSHSRSIQVSIVRRPLAAAAHATFIDLRTGVYGKPADAGRSLVGMPHLEWDTPVDAAPDPAHSQATLRAAARYLPWIQDRPGESALRSADGYGQGDGLLGDTNVPNVLTVRPWNGGGVKAAPEAGRRIADACLSRLPAPVLPER